MIVVVAPWSVERVDDIVEVAGGTVTNGGVMADDLDVRGSVERADAVDDDDDDHFHDPDGVPVLGDASAFEVGLYAQHCWVLGLDPQATAALLRGE